MSDQGKAKRAIDEAIQDLLGFEEIETRAAEDLAISEVLGIKLTPEEMTGTAVAKASLEQTGNGKEEPVAEAVPVPAAKPPCFLLTPKPVSKIILPATAKPLTIEPAAVAAEHPDRPIPQKRPVAEPEVVTASSPLGDFLDRRADQRTAAPIELEPDAPYDSARIFAAQRHKVGGVGTLWCQQGVFYRWTGKHYREVDKGTLRAEVYGFLDEAVTRNREGLIRFRPDTTIVNKVIDALGAAVNLDSGVRAPAWLYQSKVPGLLERDTRRSADPAIKRASALQR